MCMYVCVCDVFLCMCLAEMCAAEIMSATSTVKGQPIADTSTSSYASNVKFYRTVRLIYLRHCISISIKIGQVL